VSLRRATLTGALLLTAALTGCAGAAKPAATQPAAAKPALAADASPAQYDQLRAAFGERPDFIAVCERERPIKAVGSALEAQQWNEVLGLTEPWLAQCPVDVDFRVARTVALEKLGRAAEATTEREHAVGLVKSVLRSGDGKSAETAFVVISVGEAYSTLGAVGLRPKSQRVVLEQQVQVITVEKDGQTGDVYFNPAAHFRRSGHAADMSVEKKPTAAP
jgi:hypothetical protein